MYIFHLCKKVNRGKKSTRGSFGFHACPDRPRRSFLPLAITQGDPTSPFEGSAQLRRATHSSRRMASAGPSAPSGFRPDTGRLPSVHPSRGGGVLPVHDDCHGSRLLGLLSEGRQDGLTLAPVAARSCQVRRSTTVDADHRSRPDLMRRHRSQMRFPWRRAESASMPHSARRPARRAAPAATWSAHPNRSTELRK